MTDSTFVEGSKGEFTPPADKTERQTNVRDTIAQKLRVAGSVIDRFRKTRSEHPTIALDNEDKTLQANADELTKLSLVTSESVGEDISDLLPNDTAVIETDQDPGDTLKKEKLRKAQTILNQLYTLKPSPEGDSPQDIKLRELQSVFAKFLEDPELLLTMPPLLGGRNRSDRAIDDITEWAKMIGWESAADLYGDDRTIDFSDLEDILDINPRVEKLFGSAINRTADMHFFLEGFRLALDERLYIDRMLEEATGVIEHYLPVGKPAEATELVIDYVPRGEPLLFGYVGKVRGKHILRLPVRVDNPIRGMSIVSENPFRWQTDLSLVKDSAVHALSHELLHQKHAEIVGEENFTGYRIDDLMTDDELETQGKADILELYRAKYIEKGWIRANAMDATVKEGIATMGELYMMRKAAKDLKEQGAVISAIEVTAAYTAKDQWVKENGLTQCDVNPYNHGTNHIMKGLLRYYGIRRLPEIIARIDLPACRSILVGSPQYEAILQDPRLLPGLKDLDREEIK